MEEITIITEELRKQVINKYNEYRSEFLINEDNNYYYENDYVEDDFDEDDFDEYIDDFIEYDADQYVDQIFFKLSDNIRKSKYKKIIYLIFLEDAYEYIKIRQINQKSLNDYEEVLLYCLEEENLNILLKKFDIFDEFLLDIITIFIQYNLEQKIEDRYKNRKQIELSNHIDCLKKFKIYLLDNMQYEYTKRR